MGNEGIYGMGKEFGKATLLFAKQNILRVPRRSEERRVGKECW